MITKELRRNERFPATEPVEVGWEESDGPKFARATCLNISPEGISMRMDQALPVRSHVTFRSAKLKLSGTASVRYCIRRNSWYQVGLEFNPGVRFNKESLTFA